MLRDSIFGSLARCHGRGVLTAPDLAAYGEAQAYERAYAPSTHDSYLPEPTGIGGADLSIENRRVAHVLHSAAQAAACRLLCI